MTSYTIQQGDFLFAIAERLLGDGEKWKEIYELNKTILGPNPNFILPGTTIKIPSGSVDPNNGNSTNKSHTVQSGDSLFIIAEKHLGDGEKWKVIYEKK